MWFFIRNKRLFGHPHSAVLPAFGRCINQSIYLSVWPVRIARSLIHQFTEAIKTLRINIMWIYPTLKTDRTRHPDNLPHHSAGTHNPCRTQCNVAHRNVSPGHEQVFYILAV